MSFITLYKKTCVDPKEINFLNVAAKIKTPIPPSVLAAFKKKVPGIPGAPFDVYIEWDQNSGKCRLAVKKLKGGEVDLPWEDEAAKQNKESLEDVNTELKKWDGALKQYHTEVGTKALANLTAIVDGLEKRIVSKTLRPNVDEDLAKATEKSVEKLGNANKIAHLAAERWWNAGGGRGFADLLEMKRVEPDRLTQSAMQMHRNLEGLYAQIKQSWEKLEKAYAEIAKEVPLLGKRMAAAIDAMDKNEAVQESLNAQIVEQEGQVWKDLKMIESYKLSDFTELKYEETLKAATEFANKGNTYTLLYRNPASMQKVIERNGERFESSRIRGARVERIWKAWSNLPANFSRDPKLRKGLELLSEHRKEYMDQLAKYQRALNAYTAALKPALQKALAKQKEARFAAAQAGKKAMKAKL